MTGIKRILATAALVAVASSAHAQIVVLDPAALVKDAAIAVSTAQTVVNGYTEIKAIAHGNFYGITSLVPGLSSGIASNPLGADAASAGSLMSGIGTGGGMSSLFQQFLGQTQTFVPTGTDPEAVMLRQRAAAAAGQLAIGQQFLNGSASRLSMLPGLVSALAGTLDIKSAMDANTRANSEAMTQSAQAAQIQALQIYQQGEENAERTREELSARQGAEGLVAQSQAAANAAANGTITLVTNNAN